MVAATAGIIAVLAECSQRIVVEPAALKHMARHRQVRWFATEAGGQLFGTVSETEVIITKATGPYRGDARWRCSYRSYPKAAQKAIDENAGLGLMYLGEWHTHPEATPTASTSDHLTILELHSKSTLRLSCVVLIIQGTERLAIHSVDGGGLRRWTYDTSAFQTP
jgi:integrative and conjugative element protein (TIGR02256 family)